MLMFLILLLLVKQIYGDALDISGQDANSSSCKDVYPYELDIGIYWAGYGEGTVFELEKSCINAEVPYISRFFNPHKKTFIITHGDQPHIVADNYVRLGYQDDIDLLIGLWLMRGWNVGIFQWAQFADEPIQNFENAQAKIWSSHYFRYMEYTYLDKNGNVQVGEYSTSKTVADIFMSEILGHNISHLRLAGHSLGTQLVFRVAYLLLKNNKLDILDRVVGLDPVFSSLPQGYLFSSPYGMYIADNIAEYIHLLIQNGVACEIHQTSELQRCVRSVGANRAMMQYAAYARWVLNIWGEKSDGDCYSSKLWGDPNNIPDNLDELTVQLINQHKSVVQIYMQSLVYPPLRCNFAPVVDASLTGPLPCIHEDSLSLSAAMPDQQVLAWNIQHMDVTHELEYFQEYDNGDRTPTSSTMTVTPGDDYFSIKKIKN